MTLPSVYVHGVSVEDRERIAAERWPVSIFRTMETPARFAFFWHDEDPNDFNRLLFDAAIMGSLDANTQGVWLASPDENTPLRSLWMFYERDVCFTDPVEALRFLIDTDLRTMLYREYLKTDHWKGIRHEAIERAGYRCQLCNSDRQPFHVHHRTYERRGEEEPEDVIALCAHCHGKFHDKIPEADR
jgi:hypothetical protein